MRVEANFEHSGLLQYYTGLVLGDNSRTPLRTLPIFDAIVTDRMSLSLLPLPSPLITLPITFFNFLVQPLMASEQEQGRWARRPKRSGSLYPLDCMSLLLFLSSSFSFFFFFSFSFLFLLLYYFIYIFFC